VIEKAAAPCSQLGVLLSRGVDARYLMIIGLITMGLGNYWTSRLTLEISPCADWHPNIRERAGARKMRIHMNDGRLTKFFCSGLSFS
jgi:hypothetical protein